MTRDWQPGDVAIWEHDDGSTEVVFRFLGGDGFDIPEWQTDTAGCGYPSSDQLRPAVVIDPEDREQVEQIAAIYANHGVALGYARNDEMDSDRVDSLQAALRSLIAPPKPPEPIGIGAVIEDDEGVRWVRTSTADDNPWLTKWGERWLRYCDIAAVRVLSEGVTP